MKVWALILIVIFSLMGTIRFMITSHPHQNLYFNLLAGRDMKEVKNSFELDYWGLSYRKALEYILRNDKGDAIKIYVANLSGRVNANILSHSDRKRLIYVDDLNDAEYFLSEYRWHRKEYPYRDEYYSVKIDGAKIMVVYRL